jgi:hypothetical protein
VENYQSMMQKRDSQYELYETPTDRELNLAVERLYNYNLVKESAASIS